MHLLVVEDSADMASVLRRALREEGYDVHVAETGLDAVAAVERSAYDAILSRVCAPFSAGGRSSGRRCCASATSCSTRRGAW
jgi:DNA-binding response OmpR family regulator